MGDFPSGKKIALWAFVAVLFALAVTWIAQGSNFFMYKVFAPQQEQVRREVFENTKSYNQGMIQELDTMRLDYYKTKDPEAKQALVSVILHRSSGYNLNDPDVPADLRGFILSLRNPSSEMH